MEQQMKSIIMIIIIFTLRMHRNNILNFLSLFDSYHALLLNGVTKHVSCGNVGQDKGNLCSFLLCPSSKKIDWSFPGVVRVHCLRSDGQL